MLYVLPLVLSLLISRGRRLGRGTVTAVHHYILRFCFHRIQHILEDHTVAGSFCYYYLLSCARSDLRCATCLCSALTLHKLVPRVAFGTLVVAFGMWHQVVELVDRKPGRRWV